MKMDWSYPNSRTCRFCGWLKIVGVGVTALLVGCASNAGVATSTPKNNGSTPSVPGILSEFPTMAPAPGRGLVAGGILACFGAAVGDQGPTARPILARDFLAGRVVVLAGVESQVSASPGVTKTVLPTQVVKSSAIAKGIGFQFQLAPGEYVLAAFLAGAAGPYAADPYAYQAVTVHSGESQWINLEFLCF